MENKTIKAVFECDFSNKIECDRCMLSFSDGENTYCAGLALRPMCLDVKCRKDCPLKIIEVKQE